MGVITCFLTTLW